MPQSSSSKNAGECPTLMASTASAVKLGGSPKFGGDHDECSVKQSLLLEILNQRGNGDVQLLNQSVLLQYAIVVDVPADAIQEVEVMRNLDKADPSLDQATT